MTYLVEVQYPVQKVDTVTADRVDYDGQFVRFYQDNNPKFVALYPTAFIACIKTQE
jgi:hypothetical protein